MTDWGGIKFIIVGWVKSDVFEKQGDNKNTEENSTKPSNIAEF
jgi:hypothetical protein